MGQGGPGSTTSYLHGGPRTRRLLRRLVRLGALRIRLRALLCPWLGVTFLGISLQLMVVWTGMGTGRIRGRRTTNDLAPSFSLQAPPTHPDRKPAFPHLHLHTHTYPPNHTQSSSPTTLPFTPPTSTTIPTSQLQPNPTQIFRSQSMHHHASHTFPPPIPPPLRRKRPESVQLTGGGGGKREREGSLFFETSHVHISSSPSHFPSLQPRSTTVILFPGIFDNMFAIVPFFATPIIHLQQVSCTLLRHE